MLIFISNYFNHHQVPLSQELYNLTDGNFRFIELEEMPQSFKDSGYPSYDDCPMLVQAWKSADNMKLANDLVRSAEVVIYGSIKSYKWIMARLNDGKLTFECGERWLKRGWLNILSPRLLRAQWLYHTNYYNKPLYRLNASAYAADDMKKLHSFKGRCYKWGYFTAVPDLDIEAVIRERAKNVKPSFIVVARLISWKRVELVVEAAKRLRERGLSFDIDIYGSGPEKKKLERRIAKYCLTDCVKLCGNVSNDKIHELMREHDALLFTSDKNEGWGAVANEAMSNGCPVIGSHAIGAVPFLINDGVNGLVFESGNIEHLASRMWKFAMSKEIQHDMAVQSYLTMKNDWSPAQAARRLIRLIHDLQSGNSSEVAAGPCSLA